MLRPLAAALALLLSTAACAPRVTPGPGAPNPAAPTPEAAVLTGTVTYRPRIALPPDATVRVRLEDVSLADAPAPVLAEQTIAAEGRQVPFPFALRYSPAAVEPRRSYAVQPRFATARARCSGRRRAATPCSRATPWAPAQSRSSSSP